MSKLTLQQQMKSCIKLGITFFDGIDGEHDLVCPACHSMGDVESNEYLLCLNENCRVQRFFTI